MAEKRNEVVTLRVLVTGGSGFIGTNLVEYYLAKGVSIVNLDIAPPRNPEHKPYWEEVDINTGGLHIAVANFAPTHIVHLAAQTGIIDKARKLEDYATNFRGLQNLIEVSKDTPSLRRLISTSSMSVCRIGYQPKSEIDFCPDTLYGKSKVLGETTLREAGVLPYSWVIVRPTAIWGSWFDTAYYALFNLIRKGIYVHPAGANISCLLGYVGNTVYQLDKLLQAPENEVHGKVFYLADYPPINMRVWTNLVQRAFRARKIYEVPIRTLKAVALVGDIIKLAGWDYPPLSSSRLKNMLTNFTLDLAPIITETSPYKLEEAVQITVNWMRKQKGRREKQE